MHAKVTPRRTAQLVAIGIAIVGAAFATSCGTELADQSAIDRSGIIVESGSNSQEVSATTTPQPVADAQTYVVPTTVDILSSEALLSTSDIESLTGFKMSKSYNVEGLKGATHAIYGFFGPDPYSRREIEIRFYPDHATALDNGVEFAEESTGPNATLSSSAQRWDEGISQRRACRANARGSHHTGRCNAAKYGDYIVFGNIIALCEGADSEIALRNCNEFAQALQ